MANSAKCSKCGEDIAAPEGVTGDSMICPSCRTVSPLPTTGKNPLGPRDLGEIISDMFGMYFKNFWTVLGISVLGNLPAMLIGAIVAVVYIIGVAAVAADLRQWLYLAVFVIPVIVLALLLAVVASILRDGALVFAAAEQLLRRPEVFRSFKPALRRFWRMAGAGLLIGLAVLGLCITVIGIPFAIYFAITWSFTIPAIIIEGRSISDAMSRSRQLVKNNFWRVFGIGFVVVIIVMTISFAVSLVPYLNWVAAPLIQPLQLFAVMLLYFDLRVRKEGCTPEQLAAELGLPDPHPED